MSSRNIRSAIRAFAITLEPMNHAPRTLTFYGKVRHAVRDAADFGKRWAQELGVSPLCIAVTVREI